MKTLRVAKYLFFFTLLVAASVGAGPEKYTFTDVNGNSIRLADYQGKWVVVNYWATWCPPCLEEIPELVHFHDTHKDKDAVVLGINMDENDSVPLARFVDDNMISYPVVRKTDDMPLFGNVSGLPTTYLLDPSGKTAAVQVGRVTVEMIESFMANYSDNQ